MSRTTIDFGIDLGTTNSAVAVLRGTVTDIVKNNLDNDITPSAVYIDRRGHVHLGQRAKQRQEDLNAADDVYAEFKRRMGTDHTYRFKTVGRSMRPDEISAEVLKSLRGDVQQRLNEDIQAAVITVPAVFEQKQCAATKRAGELAGFSQCPLLQEPVAAALAYGFQADVQKEYWLVYDFGGGTFDAAIMKADDGSIAVVNHGGDNYLGGSDIDWAIIEQLVIPSLVADHNLPDFSRGNKKWRTALAVVKRAVEAAKIQLSRSDTAYLEGCLIKDADGEEIDLDFKLTRAELVGVAEPLIMRSVEICKRVMKEKSLAPGAIAKMILVGGPTLAPYFREMLQSSLGIQLDHSVDPLTVVARGAAVFAGTQRLESKAAPKAAAGEFGIDLKYKPVGPDEDPTIRGEVKATPGTGVANFTIEFINEKTGWRSGQVPMKADGRFKVNLLAEKGSQNVFGLELRDAKGTKQVTVPDKLHYTIGLAISEQPIINSIAIGLANNDTDVAFKKGDSLPATFKHVYRSSEALKKGQTGDALKVPLVEGEIALADRNRLLGILEIKGTNIRRDLPAGTEIEITVHIDASRILRVKAYVPMLDEEYEAKIVPHEQSPDHSHLQQDHESVVKRMNALREKANEAADDKADQLLNEAEHSEDVESLIDAAKADPDAANKAANQLLEIKVKLDQAEDALRWPAMVAEANKALDELDELIEQREDSQCRERAEKLREEVEELIEQQRADPLRKRMAQIADLHREIVFEDPGFWLGFFNYLVEERDKMSEGTQADRLINQGRQCVDRGNVQGLRSVVAQLLGLLPREVADSVQRGFGKGVLR